MMDLTPGPGGQSENSLPSPQALTHLPSQPEPRKWRSTASSAHDRLPLTENLPLIDQYLGSSSSSSPSHGSSAHSSWRSQRCYLRLGGSASSGTVE